MVHMIYVVHILVPNAKVGVALALRCITVLQLGSTNYYYALQSPSVSIAYYTYVGYCYAYKRYPAHS